jgi:phosphoribosylaminoimidazolecarboxamide formyltransferase / IMP cyclohydrolase
MSAVSTGSSPEPRRVRRALLSVSNSAGLAELASALSGLGVELIATGSTAERLRAAGLSVTAVAEVTGFPEILDGRVKTLHPAIHGGILAMRADREPGGELERLGLRPIDLVVCNFYLVPEVEADATPEAILAKLDIGGPAMVRAAAKNLPEVAVCVDPSDYGALVEELRTGGGALSLETRRRLALRAIQHVSAYDATMLGLLQRAEKFPQRMTLAFEKVQSMRYGENPHQAAALYRSVPAPAFGLAAAKQRSGKELSYNNILDAESALWCVTEFASPAVAIIKHNNPCGLATASTAAEAFRAALASDPVSAFGCVLAVNVPVDAELGRAILDSKLFIEVMVAPAYEQTAFEALSAKKKNTSFLELPWPWKGENPLQTTAVLGGMLLQDRDRVTESPASWRLVAGERPEEVSDESLLFAWKAAKVVRSNAIVLVQGTATVGVGAGQMSRVDSVQIAVRKAGDRARGSVLGSDAFFPFPDGVEAAAEAGVRVILQPGGSKNDESVIEAARKAGVAMLLTGVRHFRH